MQNEPSYQKLIHEYLEGNLSSDEEKQLFDSLSANTEWRDELAFQMRMQQSVQKDLGSVSIPANTTAGIFSSVGFEVPQNEEVLKERKRRRVPFAFAFQGLFATLGKQSIVFGMGILSVIGIGSYFMFNKTSSDVPNKILMQGTGLVHYDSLISSESGTPEFSVSRSDIKNTVSNQTNVEPVMIAENKTSQDIGKFSSVDYLTKTKVIGIASAGKIYFSNDGGLLWSAQSPQTKNDLFGVHFMDSLHGIVVGAAGAILVTANAGRSWKVIPPLTEANLISVRYASRDTLYATGAQGIILQSTNAGSSWRKLESPTKASLFKIKFENGSKGSISGEDGITLRTDDGGKNWRIKK